MEALQLHDRLQDVMNMLADKRYSDGLAMANSMAQASSATATQQELSLEKTLSERLVKENQRLRYVSADATDDWDDDSLTLLFLSHLHTSQR